MWNERQWWKELILPFEDLLPANGKMRRKRRREDEKIMDDVAILGEVFDQTFGEPVRRDIGQLRRKILRLEYRVEREKRKARALGIWAAILMLLGLLPITLILLGIALVRYFAYRSHQQELAALRREYYWLREYGGGRKRQVDWEKEVLQCALRHSGKLYPEQLVLECDMNLATARQFLDRCVHHRIAQLEVDENGRTYYYFPSFDHSSPA